MTEPEFAPESAGPAHLDAGPTHLDSDIEGTQRLPTRGTPKRVHKVDEPNEAEGQTQRTPRREALPHRQTGGSSGWRLPLILGGLTILGGIGYWVYAGSPFFQRNPRKEANAPETVPPGARIYLDQARAGDAHAMRMLGVMYYYGLNIPQDRAKGLYWYRKAAEKGSEAARSELSKLEGRK